MKTNFPTGGFPYKRPKSAAPCDAPACRADSPPRRTGATLTEVLMALLVMGVGILPVMGLFPVAFLRSVQATNRTHATIHRYNAEAAMDLERQLITGLTEWQAGTAYVIGDEIVPEEANANDRFYRVTIAGTSGATPPVWPPNISDTVVDNTITWEAFDHSVYVIDPLGWKVVEGESPGLEDILGNDGGSPPATLGSLPRYNADKVGIDLIDTPYDVVTLPDSWATTIEGIPTTQTATSVDLVHGSLASVTVGPFEWLPGTAYAAGDWMFPRNEDLSSGLLGPNGKFYQAATGGTSSASAAEPTWGTTVGGTTNDNGITWTCFHFAPPLSRVVVTDGAGDLSAVREISSISGQTINWLDALNGLTAEQLRVESQERRYTWMAAVRRDPAGGANVEIAIFFRRPLSIEDERVYTVQNEISDRVVFIDYGNDPTNPPRPFAKRGGFLLDIDNGRFYRIQTLLDNKDEDPNDLVDTDTQVLLTLERPSVNKIQNAVFMRNIIDVYPIGTK